MDAVRKAGRKERGVLLEVDAIDVGMRRKSGSLDDLDLEPFLEAPLRAPRRTAAHHAAVDEDDPWSLPRACDEWWHFWLKQW